MKLNQIPLFINFSYAKPENLKVFNLYRKDVPTYQHLSNYNSNQCRKPYSIYCLKTSRLTENDSKLKCLTIEWIIFFLEARVVSSFWIFVVTFCLSFAVISRQMCVVLSYKSISYYSTELTITERLPKLQKNVYVAWANNKGWCIFHNTNFKKTFSETTIVRARKSGVLHWPVAL